MSKEDIKVIIGDNNIYEFPKIYKEYKNKKIIYGMKTNLDNEDVIILVKNKLGLKNLYKYVSNNILDDKEGLILIKSDKEISKYYDDCEQMDIFEKDNRKLGNGNIREIVMKEANKLYENNIPNKIIDRIEEELNIIENNNYGGVYLLLRDIVKYNNDNGYHVMARGKIGSSLVAYILKITDIDPIKYDIDITNILDVDLNVAATFHNETIEFIKEQLGYDRVFIAGVVTNNRIGKHPGGVIIVPNNLEIYDITPVKRDVTYFDYHDIDSCAIKINILAHDYPTWIKVLESETNISINSISIDDKNVFKSINKSNSTGIFDLEKESFKSLLTNQVINNIDDFIVLLSISSNQIDSKINYKYTTNNDIYNYLIKSGISKCLAQKLTVSVKTGKIKNSVEWNEIKEQLDAEFVKYAESIKYMVYKSHVISYALYDYYLLWYKYYYKDTYYKTYFEVVDNNSKVVDIQRKFRLGYNHAVSIYQSLKNNE